ncbi:MAG: hypothetical protein ACFB14_02235 [Leptolyngbyaceae cyanobacterium]
MSRYAVLIGEIERELDSLQNLVEQTSSLVQKVRVTGDLDYSFDLIPEKVENLANNLPDVYALLESDLRTFTHFLANINGSKDRSL